MTWKLRRRFWKEGEVGMAEVPPFFRPFTFSHKALSFPIPPFRLQSKPGPL